jgi:hypothetical protein
MGVYELSGAGSLKTPRTVYSSMNGNNQFGAMVPIANSTITSTGAFDFSNIPQTYQDLRVVLFVRSTNANATGDAFVMYFNHGAGFQFSGYSSTNLAGDGSSAVSNRESSTSAIRIPNLIPTTTQTAGVFASITFDILNYRSSTFKTAILRGAGDTNGAGQTSLTAGLSQNTGAITGLLMATGLGVNHFAANSTATLYGIRAVSS